MEQERVNDRPLLCKFDFTADPLAGYVPIGGDLSGEIPLYDERRGFGFVRATCAVPPREVHTDGIRSTDAGFVIREERFDSDPAAGGDDDNGFGMAFRIKAAPGAYEIRVETVSSQGDTAISVSGMRAGRLLDGGFWDSAFLVPVRTQAVGVGHSWTFRFANGRDAIDIEVEPKRAGAEVGIARIELIPLPRRERPAGALPTLFTLGDSTVKSYTFEEAPMSGWGQVFDDLFDLSRIHVVNYSMGGRSFKNSYWEGRFNDILLTGCVGDYLLIQFGHNDEMEDEGRRFGRGSTEADYERWIREVYIPAIRARGLIPVFVTPMSRVNGEMRPTDPFVDSFGKRKFPDILRRVAAGLGAELIDLNEESVRYYRHIGYEAAIAIAMAIEAGETPGKTNDGSYANGHPANKIDGTHYKEALAKPFARIVAEGLVRIGASGRSEAAPIASYLREDAKAAAASGDWSGIYPEMAVDTTTGPGAYYRNQIEKLLQLGVLSKDEEGRFRPGEEMDVREFASALSRLMSIPPERLAGESRGGPLTREVMGAILHEAYTVRFEERPKYMTDYNGNSVVPGSPGYDPNLDSGARGAMYYPLVPYERLTDTGELDPALAERVRAAYELGLIRSERGIERGRTVNGTELEPKRIVTRAKAAKALYYMWVLANPVRAENDKSRLEA